MREAVEDKGAPQALTDRLHPQGRNTCRSPTPSRGFTPPFPLWFCSTGLKLRLGGVQKLVCFFQLYQLWYDKVYHLPPGKKKKKKKTSFIAQNSKDVTFRSFYDVFDINPDTVFSPLSELFSVAMLSQSRSSWVLEVPDTKANLSVPICTCGEVEAEHTMGKLPIHWDMSYSDINNKNPSKLFTIVLSIVLLHFLWFFFFF